MPRRPNVIPTEHLHIKLDASARAQVDLHLYSPLEGRVPRGAHKAFFERLINEHFTWATLDLSAYGFSPGSFIRGPKPMVDELASLLERVGL